MHSVWFLLCLVWRVMFDMICFVCKRKALNNVAFYEALTGNLHVEKSTVTSSCLRVL